MQIIVSINTNRNGYLIRNKSINVNIETNVIIDNTYPIMCSLFFNILSSIAILILSAENVMANPEYNMSSL